MSQLEQLESAVKSLPKPDYDTFRNWFLEYDFELWDAQIERDSKDPNSPIMRLAARALKDHALGMTPTH